MNYEGTTIPMWTNQLLGAPIGSLRGGEFFVFIGSNSALNYLSSLMFELGAVDLGYVGARFTWCNKRWGRGSIKERLDRGIVNMEWRTKFPRATVLHLGAVNSDHCPLLIDTNPIDVRCPRPFHFEVMWAEDA